MQQASPVPLSSLFHHRDSEHPVVDVAEEVSWFSDDSSDSDAESESTWSSDSDFSNPGPQTPYSISPRPSALHLPTDGLPTSLWKPVYRKHLPQLPYSQCLSHLSPPVSPRTVPANLFPLETMENRPSESESEIRDLKAENWIMVRRIEHLERENARLLKRTRLSPPVPDRFSTQQNHISRNGINRRTSSS
ncbi:hypothetical protein NEOLI_001536 [Neolecta irregularis DAH-3]|uniref:Uncharacterized protein n=1 Tax=Neolecta irregularis (strain DAH-3) TaxID=1198029 RepID=A0A1U7LV58_NEOID|nr:hypothetical protein NEOLI_001536 [Neolecta irregularis DAH-3]|eukprot:OLL26401.1 hypothetical protein NEOLI_001536 [Neolecta irregularis DAH-3]